CVAPPAKLDRGAAIGGRVDACCAVAVAAGSRQLRRSIPIRVHGRASAMLAVFLHHSKGATGRLGPIAGVSVDPPMLWINPWGSRSLQSLTVCHCRAINCK